MLYNLIKNIQNSKFSFFCRNKVCEQPKSQIPHLAFGHWIQSDFRPREYLSLVCLIKYIISLTVRHHNVRLNLVDKLCLITLQKVRSLRRTILLTSIHKTLCLLVEPFLVKGSDIILVLSPGVMSLSYRGLKP